MNINGATQSNLEGIREWLKSNGDVDLLLVGETNRRRDAMVENTSIDGYHWCVKERGGAQKGGLIFWKEGLRVEKWTDAEAGPQNDLREEHLWTIIDKGSKIAVANVYLATENKENPAYKDWNRRLLAKLDIEMAKLKARGCQVITIEDFNGHIGQTGGAQMANKPQWKNDYQMDIENFYVDWK